RVHGHSVAVFLGCGRPGPLSVHTPDVCYPGAGYELAGTPIKCRIDAAPPADFWAAKFEQEGVAVPGGLRIFWAWSPGTNWQAPENPRLSFARFPILYKLYAIREAAPGAGRLDDDPATELLRQLLPELGKVLFPTP